MIIILKIKLLYIVDITYLIVAIFMIIVYN